MERLSDQAATSACTRTRLTVTSQASSSVRPVERLSEPAAASASTRTRLTVTSQASNLCDLCGKDCSDKPCLSLHIHIYHCARRDFNQASSCVRRVEKLLERATTSVFTFARLIVTPQASSSVRPVERLLETAAASTRTRLTVNSQVLLCLCPQVAQDARGGLRGEGQLAASPHLHHPVGQGLPVHAADGKGRLI